MLFNIDFKVFELIGVVGLEFDVVNLFVAGFEDARIEVFIVIGVVMDIKTDLVVFEFVFIGAIDVVASLFMDFDVRLKVVVFDVVNVVRFLAIENTFVFVVNGNVVASVVVVDFIVVFVVVGDDVVFVVVSVDVVVFVSFVLKFFSVVVFSLLDVS